MRRKPRAGRERRINGWRNVMAFSLSGLLRAGRAAFVMSEVQEGIIGDLAPWPELAAAANRIGLVGNAARIAEAARACGAPVVHCTAEYLPGRFGANGNARLFGNARKRTGGLDHDPRYERPPPQVWREGDILLPRYHGVSPMTGSPLDSVLRNHGVTTVILSGVSLSFAILNLTFDAVNRAYQVILPSDAVAGHPEDYARQVMTNTLSMLGTIATTDEILEAWRAARSTDAGLKDTGTQR
jgi:biuret amidohydrolase